MLLFVAASFACTRAPQPAAADAQGRGQSVAARSPTLAPQTECDRAQARYLEARASANRCERDAECAENWPGVCPHGPYYAHVRADRTAIDEAAAAIDRACEPADCEMPMPLGIAHCEAGRCIRGRAKPESTADESCWDTQVTYMAGDRMVIADAYEHLTGTTPLHAVGVPREGTLRVSATLGCDACQLRLSPSSGFGSPLVGTLFTPEPDPDPAAIVPVPSRSPPAMGREVHQEFAVQPGPYFMAVVGATGVVSYEVELRDAAGAPMEPDRRGVVHLRVCEG